jgi:methylisocitrate lyase
VDKRGPEITAARRLREVMARGTVAIPGAFNALTAKQIERAGFEAAYLSGAAVSASRGVPDIGLLSMTEMAAEAATIAHAVSIPVLGDIDTGFGPPLIVARTIAEFERAGLAGVQLEDQEMPKRCGHLPGKRLVTCDEMVTKLRAACDARRDPDFTIVARTDARGVEGFDAAVARATAYAGAGADVIFPEALESLDEFRAFADRMAKAGVDLPLLANMTEFGQTPYLSVKDFEEAGYRLVLFPVTALRIAAKAVETMLQGLKAAGSQGDAVDRMLTRQELYDLLDYDDYEARQRRLGDRDDTA